MLKIIIVAAMALAVVGCSDATLTKINTSLDKFDSYVDNFNAAAARIDTSIAKTSASLAKYCTDAKIVGGNLVPLVSNETARAGLNSVTAGLNTWCAAPPTDVGSALSAMSAVVKDGKAAYVAAKGK